MRRGCALRPSGTAGFRQVIRKNRACDGTVGSRARAVVRFGSSPRAIGTAGGRTGRPWHRKSATIPVMRAASDVRIADVAGVRARLVLGTLGGVETALAALGIAHVEIGVQAAVASLARTVKV